MEGKKLIYQQKEIEERNKNEMFSQTLNNRVIIIKYIYKYYI